MSALPTANQSPDVNSNWQKKCFLLWKVSSLKLHLFLCIKFSKCILQHRIENTIHRVLLLNGPRATCATSQAVQLLRNHNAKIFPKLKGPSTLGLSPAVYS